MSWKKRKRRPKPLAPAPKGVSIWDRILFGLLAALLLLATGGQLLSGITISKSGTGHVSRETEPGIFWLTIAITFAGGVALAYYALRRSKVSKT